jgi:hypothetical protein
MYMYVFMCVYVYVYIYMQTLAAMCYHCGTQSP